MRVCSCTRSWDWDENSASPATTMTNRGAIAAAFVAGAMLVAVAVVAYGGAAPTAEMSLAEKKAALAALSHLRMHSHLRMRSK